jgi:hypothetical protein
MTQSDFNFPYPVLRTTFKEEAIVASQIEVVSTNEGKRLKLRFIDITSRAPTTHEFISDLPNAVILSTLLTEAVPQVGLFAKSSYCTVMEAPNRALYLMLSPEGREILEEEKDAGFLLDGIRGGKFIIHTDTQLHQHIPPPYITLNWKGTGERMWYFKSSINKGTLALRDELLSRNWAIMDYYLK